MKILKSILARFGLLGLLAAATLFLTACDGGKTGGATATGPSAGASFAGAVVSFNPTITFTSGTAFSWSNNSGDNADLVITAGTPVTGTYTYTPSGDFLTGTLTFTFSDEISPITLNLSNFNGSKSGIKSFSIGYKTGTYTANVLGSGSALIPYVTVTVGGGTVGGGTKGDSISSGTTYNGTVGAVVAGGSVGPNASSLTPTALATGATSFKVSSDRSKLFFNGRTVGVTAGTSVPGLGGTGTYALSIGTSSITTMSVIFNTSGTAVGASYAAFALSGSGASFSQKSITQEISIP